jgi:hypothetical protein
MSTKDFFGEPINQVVDERRPLILAKQKIMAKAIRKYLIGYVKRRIAAYSSVSKPNTYKIGLLRDMLNSLQNDMQYSYRDFCVYIRRWKRTIDATLPKRPDRSTHIIHYIYSLI